MDASITRETLVTNLREACMPVCADIAHSLILDLEAAQTANEQLEDLYKLLIEATDSTIKDLKANVERLERLRGETT